MTVTAAENGAVTVKGTRVNEVSITKDSTNTHVDYDSAITITAEPEKGYYVKSLTVGGKTFDYDSQNTYQSGTRTETVKNITADTAVTAVFGKEPVIVFSGTYADITAQNGSLNSGSFVFMHTPMLEFLAAPHFGYELTAWTVNGNAITSGI